MAMGERRPGGVVGEWPGRPVGRAPTRPTSRRTRDPGCPPSSPRPRSSEIPAGGDTGAGRPIPFGGGPCDPETGRAGCWLGGADRKWGAECFTRPRATFWRSKRPPLGARRRTRAGAARCFCVTAVVGGATRWIAEWPSASRAPPAPAPASAAAATSAAARSESANPSCDVPGPSRSTSGGALCGAPEPCWETPGRRRRRKAGNGSSAAARAATARRPARGSTPNW
jgi:hypothetical protein